MSDVTFELRKAYVTALQAAGVTVFDEIADSNPQQYAIIGIQTAAQVSNKNNRYITTCRVNVECIFRQRISSSRQEMEDVANLVIGAIRGNSLTLHGYLMHTSVMVDSTSETVTTQEKSYSKKTITFEHNIEAI